MAIVNGYCTLAELKARLWPSGVTPDGLDDAALEGVIENASRYIDERTGRRFWKNSVDEARVFMAEFEDILFPNIDIVSITTLKTDEDGDGTFETTWSAGEYKLQPANAALDNKPYTMIVLGESAGHAFPDDFPNGVEITGKFGWPAVPRIVQEACLMEAQRLWKRRDAPLGIVGTSGLGDVRMAEQDADIEAMLGPVTRLI
jgi:hypothetical protein